MIIRTVEEVVRKKTDEQVKELLFFVDNQLGLPVSREQLVAWEGCIEFLKKEFQDLHNLYKFDLVFEYPLTNGSLKRPDVLILSKNRVHVLEFKSANEPIQSHVEQVLGYTKDIRDFHWVTQEKTLMVTPYIVLPNSEKISEIHGIPVLTKDSFTNELNLENEEWMSEEEAKEWIDSQYYCLPDIIEATLQLFEQHELPYIKNIAEGDIAETVLFIKNLIKDNIKNKKRKRIIFLSGVPGSGKTLVALQLLHDIARHFLTGYNEPLACYTSGNDALINVLQSQLEKTEFVNSRGDALIWQLKNLKTKHSKGEHIGFPTIFFDEAQRAWNLDERTTNKSDPEFILELGQKILDQYGFANIICCMGEGQAIHKREEGPQLWKKAFEKYSDWDIYSSDKLALELDDSQYKVTPCKELNLDTSIRNNFIDTSKWIEAVLNGNDHKAFVELQELLKQGFVIRLCRNLQVGRKFVEKWVKDHGAKTYGYLVSSKVHFNDNYHNDINSYIKPTQAGKWFFEDSRNWKNAASEFLCQGLEIDVPLVIFSGDYKLSEGKWEIPERTRKKHEGQIRDIEQTLSNVYRVLLSRSRKALVIYIPDNEEFNETYSFFEDMDIKVIEINN